MSTTEIISKITELQELKRMQEELTAEIDTITDLIKEFMGDTEQLSAGAYKISYKPITTTRVDTTALKKELPDIAARFTKTTTTRRFTVQ